jgi:hypothetical protein
MRFLEQLREEVAASLHLAADTMKHSRPDGPTHRFKPGDLVWLEGKNITTTHPKAKLAPKRHGPFKVLSTTAVNSRIELPKHWHKRIHPVFHHSLLSPYKETTIHGPNFTTPPPEIIDNEEGHYELETILDARLTRNKRGLQYFVKWKGYPDSENSWLPASGLKKAQELVTEFHKRYPRAPSLKNAAAGAAGIKRG